MVRGINLTRVPVDGIAKKEGDYTNPELAREHVFCQQNWATGLGGGSDEFVLNMNHPSDVNKCAENLFGLYNDYKDSGKLYAGIAVVENSLRKDTWFHLTLHNRCGKSHETGVM